ncbi:RING-type domain-containing protein [Psidium guajava]|nr:RING-type domain-containing protein [Psidium guajava]
MLRTVLLALSLPFAGMGAVLVELAAGTECAVCLEEVDGEEPARLVPGCRHGFHQECADAWLAGHAVCPVCRANLEPRSWLEEAEDRQSPC